jgi:hypothetical protein
MRKTKLILRYTINRTLVSFSLLVSLDMRKEGLLRIKTVAFIFLFYFIRNPWWAHVWLLITYTYIRAECDLPCYAIES